MILTFATVYRESFDMTEECFCDGKMFCYKCRTRCCTRFIFQFFQLGEGKISFFILPVGQQSKSNYLSKQAQYDENVTHERE